MNKESSGAPGEWAGVVATAAAPHKSTFPDPISFCIGDVVRTGLEDSEYPGWVRVLTGDGNEGWAPKVWLREISANQAVALADYTARELDTERGDRLTVHRELAGWLWVENARGDSGWIPRETIL